MNDITAMVESVKSPERPEPPVRTTYYEVQWWSLERGAVVWDWKDMTFKDHGMASEFAIHLAKAVSVANIRIVTIPGDAPGEGGAQ